MTIYQNGILPFVSPLASRLSCEFDTRSHFV